MIVLVDVEKVQPGNQMLDLAWIHGRQQGHVLGRVVLVDGVPASLLNVCGGFEQLDEVYFGANGNVEH